MSASKRDILVWTIFPAVYVPVVLAVWLFGSHDARAAAGYITMILTVPTNFLLYLIEDLIGFDGDPYALIVNGIAGSLQWGACLFFIAKYVRKESQVSDSVVL